MESERANLAKSFIRRAEGDLKTAKGAIEKSVYADACYHAQQAVK